MNKIAFFLPSFGGGGAERAAVNLAAGFLERGYAVDFVLVQASGPLLVALPDGLQIVNLHAPRALAALPGLAHYLRQDKPQVLISALDHINLIAMWAKILAGTPTRVVINNQIQLSLSIHHTPKLQEKLYPFLLRLFQRAADVIVSVSTGSADDLAHLVGIPRQRITIIHNPVSVPPLVSLQSASPDHPWFAAGQLPVVLAAGRLTLQKDYPTLLQAFARAHQRRALRLVILGEGEQRDRLLSLAQDLGIAADVDLPGFANNPYLYMAHCGVFVLSSAWEGFGNVLAEALACGAQVVSTDCPSGPAEILEGGKYGRLVPVGDADALAGAIEDALDHPFPVEGLKERAKAFSSETAVHAYLQVLGLSPYDH